MSYFATFGVPIMFATFGILLAGCVIGLVRNTLTYTFRRRLLDSIHNGAVNDINAGRDWESRYAYFERVSYEEIVNDWRVWKSPRSYWSAEEMSRMTL